MYKKLLLLSFLALPAISAPKRASVTVINQTNNQAIVNTSTTVPAQTKALISARFTPLKNEQAKNPFYQAIMNDSCAELAALVRNGFDVNQGEVPPLAQAILLNKKNAIKFFVENGADIEKSYIDSFINSGSGDLQLVILLAQKTNSLSKYYDALLSMASQTGDKEALILLIQHGSLSSLKSGDVFFVQFSSEDIIKIYTELLKRGLKADELLMNKPWQSLWQNNHQGAGEVIQFLVKNGANPNLTKSEGRVSNYFVYTPLWRALREGSNVPAAMKLIELGADVNAKAGGPQQLTPLALIMQHSHLRDPKLVSMLLERGATLQ